MGRLGRPRVLLLLAGIAGASGVIAGSLAAHLPVAAEDAALLETAVRYHLFHALALLALAAYASRGAATERWLTAAGLLFTVGIVLFSGGLYLRAMSGHTILDGVVPVGGLGFVTGWLALVTGAFQREER